MGKYNYIFDYNKYINNVENLSNKDDLILNTKNRPYYEGLISTCDPIKTKTILNKRFPELNIQIEEDGNIYIQKFKYNIKHYNILFNNLGYYIADLTIDGKEWLTEFNDNDFILALRIELKYDTKIENIPNILYHVSSDKFTKNIEKIGLIPKSKNKLSKHPDRIYVTDNLEQAELFSNHYKSIGENPIIWKINTNNIENLILYKDYNFTPGGFYILKNIPISNLEKT